MKKVSWKLGLLVLFACLLISPSFSMAETGPNAKKAAPSKAQAPTPPKAEKAPKKSPEGPGSAEGASATSDRENPETKGVSPTARSKVDGATYQVRLRDLEQRVDELKEQIRRSHTRLSLLSDTILSGASGGGRAEIEFRNDLGGAWHVVEAVFVLDGAVQYKKSDDSGVLAKQRTIPIFSGTIPAGDHTLQVMLKLRGHGFGVFSYLRGIEAKLTSDHSFTLSEGKILELSATAWEQGGPTTPVEEQPAIRFQQTIKSGGGAGGGPQPAKSTAPAPPKTEAKKGATSGGTKVKK
jgi:hypothetical protein